MRRARSTWAATRASSATRSTSARARRTTRGSRRAGPCTASAPSRPLMIRQRFGEGPPPLTLGVEEELVVLDAETLAQVGRGPELVAALAGRELPGRAKTELHASVFELNTDPCATPEEVLAALRVMRAEAAAVAA